MMDYIFFAVTVLLSIHGYTFGRWLGVNGNKLGMFGIFFLTLINVSLSLYRVINAG